MTPRFKYLTRGGRTNSLADVCVCVRIVGEEDEGDDTDCIALKVQSVERRGSVIIKVPYELDNCVRTAAGGM